jgi:predicted AAA+ superfamily ATPase
MEKSVVNLLDEEITSISTQELFQMMEQVKILTAQVLELQTQLKQIQNIQQQSGPQTEIQEENSKKDSQNSFVNVLRKGLPKNTQNQQNQSPTPQILKKVSPLRAEIKLMASNEDILKKLVQPTNNPSLPIVEKVQEEITSLYFQTTLSRLAAKEPIFSFSKVFETMSKSKPLGLNLVSKNVVEVFIPKSAINGVRALLPPESLILHPALDLKDVKRRAASYNRGFFKALRRASLQDLNNVLSLEVLKHAEASIKNLPAHRQSVVRKAIQEDRLWVKSM